MWTGIVILATAAAYQAVVLWLAVKLMNEWR
jgi:hypothetical protein